jgi:large subunit ribosomal protein L13
MKTVFVNDKEVQRNWVVINAEGVVLGRLASQVAHILSGKNKPSYSPNCDVGDNVVIINAEKAILSGNKMLTKEYFFHSTHPGGGRFQSYASYMEKKPAYPLETAIRGMLPKSALGDRMFKKLHVYAGETHPHSAQKPESVTI